MGLQRISELEHDLNILPCSDSQCEACTGISRRVEYNPKFRSYEFVTKVYDQMIRTSVAEEVFMNHDYQLGIR